MQPEEFQIKQLNAQDISLAHELFSLFEEVFENEKPGVASENHLTQLLAKPDFIAFAVLIGNKIVGGLTAYELCKYYSDSSEVFIYDIAIKPEFQRKGLGRKLLHALQHYCSERNVSEMFVAANEEDQHALDFYRSTGGKPEKVFHFNYNLSK